jgi:predicted helicase
MTTKLQHGLEYEIYILNIIKSKYKNCWLWNDIPYNILNERFYKNNNICDDIGCDIIGINYDDTIDYIQCKNYSTIGTDNTINICDLAGFYNFIAENYITNAIVYYSGKLSQQIMCRQNKIKYMNIPLIDNNEIIKITPRDYQIEAFNKLKDINRTILSMPCGTGKLIKSVSFVFPFLVLPEKIVNFSSGLLNSKRDDKNINK